jgi:flagellar biosynthesis chaperone FliJ
MVQEVNKMVSTVGSVSGSGNTNSQLAALEKQLATDLKALQKAEKAATTQASEVQIQQLSAQISEIEGEIAQAQSSGQTASTPAIATTGTVNTYA